MEIILTLIAVFVFVVAAVSNHNRAGYPKPSGTPTIEKKVLSEVATLIPAPVLPTPKSVPTPTPVSTTAPSSNISDYIYPGANVVSSSDKSLSLTSSDNADSVTSWYKQKITSNGFRSEAFAETKANDRVMNKLGGDNGQFSIQIEISQDSADSQVKISVNLTTD